MVALPQQFPSEWNGSLTWGDASSPLSQESLPCPAGWYRVVRDVADYAIAAVLLVLSAPFILLGAILIKLTSRGPVFYSQTRLGRYGRPYTIYKLRTMAHNCEALTGPCWASKVDPRVTRVGRFLRDTHLDELPQLWNILRGEMSLVGPRPERPEFIVYFERSIPRYSERLLVKPGVTGLAQVQLPADTDLASVRRKLAYDLYCIWQPSLWLDVRIVLGTALVMVGIPFWTVRGFFRMPTRDQVEGVYGASRNDAATALPQTT
jgi:lipopolysaccharide/colanic/teichoic acid biosynthesis glycosyltransferase